MKMAVAVHSGNVCCTLRQARSFLVADLDPQHHGTAFKDNDNRRLLGGSFSDIKPVGSYFAFINNSFFCMDIFYKNRK